MKKKLTKKQKNLQLACVLEEEDLKDIIGWREFLDEMKTQELNDMHFEINGKTIYKKVNGKVKLDCFQHKKKRDSL